MALTFAQVEWAKHHDWFAGWTEVGNFGSGDFHVVAREYSYNRFTGKYTVGLVTFINFAELKAWAGY